LCVAALAWCDVRQLRAMHGETMAHLRGSVLVLLQRDAACVFWRWVLQ
jgi:hypothetical protein